MKHLILTLSLLLGLGASVSAEPSSGIATFMARPMSMLDWGMFNLQRTIQAVEANTTVSYVWDSNEIQVLNLGLTSSGNASSMEEAKKKCNVIFTKLDHLLLVLDGEDRLDEYCKACSSFAHNGFSFDGFQDAVEDLKERIFYVAYDGAYTCKRKLYAKSTSTSVTEGYSP